MDEYTTDAFVNRDEPIPTINILGNEEATAEPHKGKRDRLQDATTSKLKEKAQSLTTPEKKKYGFSLQDRLFTK